MRLDLSAVGALQSLIFPGHPVVWRRVLGRLVDDRGKQWLVQV